MKKIISFFLTLCLFVTVISIPRTANAETGLILESDRLRINISESTLALTVTDKINGYVWRSDREYTSDEKKPNESWQSRIASGITIEYFDTKTKKPVVTSLADSKADTKINVIQEKNKITAAVSLSAYDISFDVVFSIDDDRLCINIPYDSIKESEMIIKSISLYPFFGSTRLDETSGYFVVPDGSGVLMDLQKPMTKVSDPFRAKVFGADEGLGDNTQQSYILNMPIFAIIHGENKNGVLVEIEDGSAQTDLSVYPAGVGNLEYNWIHYTVSYRQQFYQTTGKDGSGFSDIQLDMVKTDISMTYTFLANEYASYVGVGRTYQNTLVKRGVLKDGITENVNVNLQVLGAEAQKGLFGFKTEVYTTASDLKLIVDDLLEDGISASIVYKGYYKKGTLGGLPNKTKFESKVASEKEMKSLIEYLDSKNIPAYFDTNYSVALQSSRINKSNDVLKKIDQKFMTYSWFYDGYTLDFARLNYFHAADTFKKDLDVFARLGMNILIADPSLTSNYGRHSQTREEAKAFVPEIFKQDEIKVAFAQPSSYMWNATSRYAHTPISGSNFLHFTQSVPLLQIVLRGYIDMYSEPQNASPNPVRDMLTLVEYGVYPSYYVTQKSPKTLINTPSDYIFSSEYKYWETKIKNAYSTINNALKDFVGAKIIAHNKKDGVAVITYDNNKQIVVNYTDNSYDYNGLTVLPKDFIVCGVVK